jgi:hypothetical protein
MTYKTAVGVEKLLNPEDFAVLLVLGIEPLKMRLAAGGNDHV